MNLYIFLIWYPGVRRFLTSWRYGTKTKLYRSTLEALWFFRCL